MRDGIGVSRDVPFTGRVLARFRVAASFGAAGEFATFALPVATVPDVDPRDPAGRLTGDFFDTTSLSAAVFAVEWRFRVVETVDLAAFFAGILPADRSLGPATCSTGG